MDWLTAGVIVLLLYWVRNVFGNLVNVVSGGRISQDTGRRWASLFAHGVGFFALFLFFGALWRGGILAAYGKGFAMLFQDLWDLLCMVPRLLWWILAGG